jgi:4-hydroxybutyrate dehydrogenase
LKQLSIVPQIYKYNNFASFAKEFEIGSDDLIITHEFIYETFIKNLRLKSEYLFQEKYGEGEPSSTMVDSILADLKDKTFKRIIAVGGGTVIDIAKILVLDGVTTTVALFEKGFPLKKGKELVIVPTTCGTGSEVTNVSVVEIKEKRTKMGLYSDEMYADQAVLIPELITSLPFKFFIISSVDALVHASESFVSPRSNSFTELFSTAAIRILLDGYLKLIKKGREYRTEIIEDFLIASTYAGIAFANTSVGAVHAISYPLSSNYHVPHGEANYRFFAEIFKIYNSEYPGNKIEAINKIFADSLGIWEYANVWDKLQEVLNKLISEKRLREYGMKEEEILQFADTVIESQQRLLVNSYIPFSKEDISSIYRTLY